MAEVDTPSPATITLPLSFQNSFWSQDYRSGYETLYKQLEAGIVQSDEILANIKRRADAERAFGANLHPTALRQEGFGIDEGASLKIGLEALLTSSVQESRAHVQLADELIKSIAVPFEDWSLAHKGRIHSSKTLVESHLSAYEKKHQEVIKLKLAYDDACRSADLAEDELAFSRSTSSTQNQTSSQSATSPTGSTSSSTIKSSPLRPNFKFKRSNSESSALDDVDYEDENDEGLVGRSGATGGSLTAAIGRAFTIRRKNGGSNGAGGSGGKDLPSTPITQAEQNVEKALDLAKSTFTSLFEKVAGPQTGEGKEFKARKEAESTEEKYKTAVEVLDNLRLVLEETLSEHYAYTNRCEHDRLKAATSVLKSFHATVSSLFTRIHGSSEKVKTSLALIRPDKDVLAIIERLRTGPFQPKPTSFHSHYSEPAIHTFGIDLRKFDETNPISNEDKVPPILTFLLDYVSESYSKVEPGERRKSWLYETPLVAQHHLRSALNGGKLDKQILGKYDLPVIVSLIKLWLLELDVPVILFSHYDEYRPMYPRVGTESSEVPVKHLANHIARLPPVHLEVLRVLIRHFHQLISTTKTDEPDEVYLQKLSLSVARSLIRPKVETPITLDDRFPGLLFIDLIKHYDEIFGSADELKTKQREDRYKPRRQRTKPIDVRISRSKMGDSVDLGRELLKEQKSGLASPPPVPPLPSLPTAIPSAPPADFINSPTGSPPPSEVGGTQATSPPPTTGSGSPPAEIDSQAQHGASASIGSGGSGGGSLTRRDGRRGARGPRPLPGANASEVSELGVVPASEGA